MSILLMVSFLWKYLVLMQKENVRLMMSTLVLTKLRLMEMRHIGVIIKRGIQLWYG